MSEPLSIEEIRSRLNHFPHDRYLYIGGFMKSVTWAAGTLVLIQICVNFWEHWPRLLPWIGSLLATLVSLTTWGRGILLTNSRANLFDSIFPTLMGIDEFCLFEILNPTRKTVVISSLEIELWTLWFFVLAAHGLLAVLLVRNRIKQTDVPKDFETNLQELGRKYKDWTKKDQAGALSGCFLFTFFGILIAFVSPMCQKLSCSTNFQYYWQFSAVLYVFPIMIFYGVIKNAESQRQEIDTTIHNIKNAQLEASENRITVITSSITDIKSKPNTLWGILLICVFWVGAYLLKNDEKPKPNH